MDGGEFTIYEGWPGQRVQEKLSPTLGKAVMFRSDLVHHTAEPVYTLKRAITLFINVKPTDDMDAPVIKHNELTDTVKADALYVTMKIF
jgi:hypothetical protein